MMTIGEAAKAVGVSPKAIRVWESRGLIPEAARTTVGYRTFTDADVSTMRFIRQAKALGLTLAEIGDVLDLRQAGTSPCDLVVQAIDTHLAAIDQAMADLAQLRQTLTSAKDTAGSACAGHSRETVCHIIERTRCGDP